MTPKISIIIPVYNSEKYLRQCLDSAMNQTLQEIEIICVDDGSTDTSGDILEEYAAKDPRFRIFHQENAGQGTARNHALKLVQGKYIAFLDSDDWLDLSFCEKMYQKAMESQADVITSLPLSLNRRFKKQGLFPNFDFSDRFSLEDRLNIMDFAIAPWLHLWKTEMIQKYHIHFSSLRFLEDIPFTVCGLVLAHKISFVNEASLYYYRDNPTSITKSTDFFMKTPQIYDEIFQHLQQYADFVDWKEPLRYKKLHHIYRFYRQVCSMEKNRSFSKAYVENVRKRLLPEDIHFWKTHKKKFPKKTQWFYDYIVLQQKISWVGFLVLSLSNYLRRATWNRRFKQSLK